jgi:hypothetical protein
MPRALLCVPLLLFSAGAANAADETVALVEKHLQAGTLAAGEQALEAVLKQQPRDDQARFGLGTVQFLRAVENLGQSLYRYGFLKSARGLLPGASLPIPDNPEPERLSYEQARKIVQTFVSDLAKAEATLAKIESTDVKLPLHFGLIRLNLNGDGTAADTEMLWLAYRNLNRAAQVTPEQAAQFVIAFDAADVHWLRGYCHLLMTLGEFNLAYNWQELFERTGHLLFPRIETPYKFLGEGQAPSLSFSSFADLIALIHLIDFPLAAPERMNAALGHLEAMVARSRRSWELILAETDDDHEWIPSPKQTGVIPNVRVTPEMVQGWQGFLTEADAILKGNKLIPFWRGNGKQGLNLRRVFTEPQRFDLVLWVQGTAAVPYLEEGTKTDPEVWDRLLRVFRGEFIGFALWFN